MNHLHRDTKASTKLMLIGWGVLLVIPACLYAFSVTMFPRIELDAAFAQLLYWITSTGTAPYGIATGIVILIACYQSLNRAEFFKASHGRFHRYGNHFKLESFPQAILCRT